MTYDSKTRYEAITAIKKGASLREAALAVDANHTTVRRWCAEVGIQFASGRFGGAIVTPKKKLSSQSLGQLTLEHRLAISIGLVAKLSHTQIATGIKFSRSTVTREISRHKMPDGSYDPYVAQLQAEKSAKRPKLRKTDINIPVRQYVLQKLALRWSPMQIAKQICLDYPDDEEMRVSHEAIYQALYVQGKGALRQELALEKALRQGRSSRLPQSRLGTTRGEGKSWVEGCEISLRPPEAQDRAVPGHWEGDLVIGGDLKSCLITLVERQTRFVLVRRLDLHPSKLITSELADMIKELPRALKRSITWDQGVEMALHKEFSAKTGVQVYFCDPHSPWQRGTNENTNGLIRDYFPKGTDFTKVTDEEVAEMQDQLNGRPRQTLGWKKPAVALMELLEKAA